MSPRHSLLRYGLTLTRRAADILLPPRCPRCGVDVPSDGALCPECWSRLTFIASPLCRICGRPFEVPAATDAVCGTCHANKPPFARARSAVFYDDESRPLILGFKHGDRLNLAPLFTAWLRAAGGSLIDDAELLIPVPLHRWRMLTRRYNQSAELARGVAAATGLSVADRVLVRTRHTPSQGRLTARQRVKNMRGAFALRNDCSGRVEVIDGRRVLLIDDVMTTGATVSACARALAAGGASAVDVLTLARVD